MSISRRQFLETTAVAGIAAGSAFADVDSKTGMPMRILGRTGAKVSILAFGSGSRWLAYKDEDKAAEALYKALDLGVTYVDTAYSYGNGESETRLGKFLKDRRKNIWLATKIPDRKGDAAMRRIEDSLKRLQTDKVDLLHMHSLTTPEDLAAIEAKDGVLNVLYKLRDQKVCRAIGITCHTDPKVLKDALEHNDLDCTQMALNAAMIGQAAQSQRGQLSSFQTIALPVANKKNMGVIAMKVFAQDKLVGKAPIDKLMQYALSLPVTAAVAGMPQLSHIDEDVRAAKAFKPMAQDEMRRLAGELAPLHKAAIDRYFSDHIDC